MSVAVNIPASLRAFADGQRVLRVDCEGADTSLREVFERLHALAPGVVERALDERGGIRPHVNVFVDGQSIRASSRLGLQSRVAADAEIWILPAVSGGA